MKIMYAHLMHPETVIKIDLHGSPAFFSFEKAWDLDVELDACLFHYIARGSCELHCGRHESELKAGDISLLAPGQKAQYKGTQFPLELYRFRFTSTPAMAPAWAFLHGRLSRDNQILLDQLLHIAEQDQPHSSLRQKCLLLAILSDLFEDKSDAGAGLSTEQMQQLRNYFNTHHRSWPQVADLANVVNLSQDYFSRVFKLSFGQSPRSWMVSQRIRMTAMQLAESRPSIQEITENFAYCDIHFFSQQFKKEMGLSPTDWRKRHQGKISSS